MASAPSFAQHYIECENCEENPAQFLCKTCSGHLCGGCKSEHESRKIFQNHDIINLASEKWGMLELLHCSEHRNEKLKCYCSPCQIPVCTQCIMETHNGHKVENLASVYSRIKDQLQKEKEEIDTTLLPKYEDLLANENEKEADISKRTDEVQRQIENHTEDIIKRFTVTKEKRIHGLRQEEEKALKLVANSKTEIKRRISELKETKTQISKNLGAKPGITFFKATNVNSLNKMRQYPDSIEYTLGNFNPDDNESIIQKIDFGYTPKFNIMKNPRKAVRTNLEVSQVHSSAPPLFGHMPSSAPTKIGHMPSSAPPLFGHMPSSAPPLFGHMPSSAPPLFGHMPSSAPIIFGQVNSSAQGFSPWNSLAPTSSDQVNSSAPGFGQAKAEAEKTLMDEFMY